MSFPRRVRTIYRKELLDILRDRRTLIAMILVPIVLYPLLLLGSVQAVSFQTESLEQEEVVIGTVGERQQHLLEQLVLEDAAFLKQSATDLPAAKPRPARTGGVREAASRSALRPVSEDEGPPPVPLDQAKIMLFRSRDEIEAAIRERTIQVGILFEGDSLLGAGEPPKHVPLADLEEVRSRHALRRLMDVLDRTSRRIVEQRLDRANLPRTLVKPFEVDVADLSAPPSILGQILPLILVLMTITTAIYPAIDLTAGERERGTLESLMVCPIAVMDLIVGKFLVVTTVAILGAALNLTSVSATVYFGGFDKVLATTHGVVPYGKMALILLCLIPFAVLMSAIMIAVCAYARTFKEAQNYVTPVILAVLVPGGIAALPTTRLEGVMLVMPVGNMVLLARDLLMGASVSIWQVAPVLLSTTLYAAAAVGIAAHVFGAESVVFTDAGSLKAAFTRRYLKPKDRPSAAMALTIVALLFPTWFFIQSAASPRAHEDASGLLKATALLMPPLFVLAPMAVLGYWKINIPAGFALRLPAGRHWIAAVFIGLSAWIPAHELAVLQQSVLPLPKAAAEGLAQFQDTAAALHPASALLILAVMPAICEELLFRGVLLTGLVTSLRPGRAILASAVIFGVFHFILFRFAVTAALGVALGYLCWRSRSVLPGMLVHLLHNGLAMSAVFWPWHWVFGLESNESFAHLPPWLIGGGALVFAAGIGLAGLSNENCRSMRPSM